MRKLISILLLTLAAICAPSANAWEATNERSTEQQERIVADRTDGDTPEVWVKDGYIYISSPRQVTVKIFSILGQLISQDSVPAGTYRLHVNARGIYILKAGAITRRITI